MLQVLILATAAIYVIVNLLVDISYAVIDPRVQDPMTPPTTDPWTAASSGSTTSTASGRRATRGAARRSPSTTRAVDETPGVSLIASAWRRLRRDPVFLVGAGITLLFVVLAIISPWIAPHDPAATCCSTRCGPQSNPIPGPRPGYPLGADDRGRDLLSRLLVGSRQTLIVGVFAT